jgi:hypothetical protein
MKRKNNLKTTRILVGALALGMAASTSALAQELVRNGTFSGNLSGWDFQVTQDFKEAGRSPQVDVRGEGFTLSGIPADHYLADGSILLSQDVDIDKGAKYRFSMEIRGDKGGIACLLYLPLGGRAHELSSGVVTHMEKRIQLADEWQAVEVEFEGKFSRGDVAAIKRDIRNAIKDHPEWDRDRQTQITDSINWKATRTRLDFRLAKAIGTVQIRNVSIRRLP